MHLATLIEGMLFVAEQPLSLVELLAACSAAEIPITEESVHNAIHDLEKRYASEDYSFRIVEISGGYQLLTKPEIAPYLRRVIVQKEQRKVSKAMLDVLAIVAYRQPITKPEIEQIRGVNCDYALTKLLEKNLVEISGRAEAPGKPLLYRTSTTFLQYFGINSLSDLPKVSELPEQPQPQISQTNLNNLSVN